MPSALSAHKSALRPGWRRLSCRQSTQAFAAGLLQKVLITGPPRSSVGVDGVSVVLASVALLAPWGRGPVSHLIASTQIMGARGCWN